MKLLIATLGLTIAFFATSCNNSSDDKESILTPAEMGNATADPGTNGNTMSASANQATSVNTPQLNQTPAVNTASVGNGALNPEHGKPGHRCDIAVGAPLNSKPAATAAVTPTTTTVSTPTITTPSSAAVTKPTGGNNLNPEHGKPGHRCDIAVGAPLDGAKPAASVQPASNPAIIPTAQKPAPVTPMLPASTPVAPGMNPEHGKPGHRCDIAVGAPLTSAAKQ